MPGRSTRASMPHLLSLLAAFVAVTVAMGVLAAGLLVPAVGALGTVTNKAIDGFDEIPTDFSPTALAQQSRIYDADNKVIATPYDQNRIIVKLSQIAPVMQQAQVAIEDSRFFEHGAVDVRGTLRAFFNNATGSSTQGGSSITQQYVKLTLQAEALKAGDEEGAKEAIDVNYGRKLRELALAMQVEKTMTKKQILQAYMNLAYYGDLAYGVEAASRHYFGIPASKLNLTQAATLAGVVQQPGSTDPHNYPEAAERRRNVVIDRMQELGLITAAQATAAKKPSVKSLLRIQKTEGGTCDRSTQPYFCNYVIAYLKTLKVLGKNVDERTLAINRGGLRIKTTLHSDWQKQIFRNLTSLVPTGDPSGVGAAAAVIQPGTGKVLAMVQTSEYGLTKSKKSSVAKTTQSWVVPQEYGGTLGFPIGSTAKVFTLLTALEAGIPVDGVIPAPEAGPGRSGAHVFPPSVYHDSCGSGADWYVSNDFHTDGPTLPFRYATAQSVNTAFAATMISLGGCKVAAMWKRLGAVDGAGKQVYATPSNLTLGSGSMTPLTLANVYATLAAKGKMCTPTPIESITTADGKKLKLPDNKCKQVLDPDVVAGADELLKGVLINGTAGGNGIGRPAAGKTGTHEGHQQSWFVGYTPQLATAVYVGTPIVAKEMAGLTIGGHPYGVIFGATIAAPLWQRIMMALSAGMPVENFPAPSYKILHGELVSVPYVVGRSVADATAILRAAGFDAVVGGTVDSSIPAGLVGEIAPSGSAARGTAITLLVSTGVPPVQTSTSSSSSSSTSSDSTTSSSTSTTQQNTNTPSGTSTKPKPPRPGTGTITPRP